MVTDISPVFGISLTALIEMTTIIGAVVGIVSAIIIARVIHNSNTKLLEHHRNLLKQQKKVDSAKMVMELHSPWRKNARFKEFLRHLNNPQATTYNNEMVDAVLNHFELMATLWKDGTLDEFHVRSFFSANLKIMRSDEFIFAHIAEAQKINPRTFIYLQMLFEKSKEWDA